MMRRWFGIGSLVLSLSWLFAGLAAGYASYELQVQGN